MSYSGMNPAQVERMATWESISSSCLQREAAAEGLAPPKVVHVVGPSTDPAKRDLVLIFEGLDLKEQEGLESILGLVWEDHPLVESISLENLEDWERILANDSEPSAYPPSDEFTIRVKWKNPRTVHVADGTLRVSWPGAYMVFPVMIRS